MIIFKQRTTTAAILFAACAIAMALFAMPAFGHGADETAVLDADSHAEADAIDPREVAELKDGYDAGDRAAAETRREANVLSSLGMWSLVAKTVPNPSIAGQWGAPFDSNTTLANHVPAEPQATPGIVPVFTAVLPNGKVLAWDYMQAGGPAVHNGTRVMLYDPVTNTSVRKDLTDAVVGADEAVNLFCAGYSHLPSGDLLIVGGNKNLNSDPIRSTFIFHWQTESWQRGPDMNRDRWYPSVVTMASGEALIVGGDPKDPIYGESADAYPEVFDLTGAYRPLTNLTNNSGDPQTLPSTRYYPFLDPAQDGRVLYAGMEPNMQMIDARGAGSKTYFTTPRDIVTRTYGSFAHYDRGKLIANGGGSMVPHLGATSSGSKISLLRGGGEAAAPAQGMPTSAAIAAMNFKRRMHYLTVLPNGEVLATGGKSQNDPADYLDNNHWDGKELVDLGSSVKAAESWNPATNTWTPLASAQKERQYHSFSTLLPDGSVLTGGGGTCGACDVYGYQEPNFEIFKPPYLFNADGSPAAQPAISQAPTAGTPYASAFEVETPQAAEISQVSLIKLGAATHSIDQGQRRVPLVFKVVGDSLEVQAPANGYEAPPGYYMLFILDADGTPSRAKIIQIGAADANAGVAAPVTAAAGSAPGDNSQVFGSGEFSAEHGHLANVGNNAIRKLTVAAGYEAQACAGIDGSGACEVFAAGTHGSLSAVLDQKVSWLRVCPASGCPPDTVAPDTTIVAAPPASTAVTSADFVFASDDESASFVCRVDAGAETPCPSAKSLSALGVGTHSLQVVAIDPSSNRDVSPASYDWTVIASPPTPQNPVPPSIKLASKLTLGGKLALAPVCPAGCKVTVTASSKAKKLMLLSKSLGASGTAKRLDVIVTKKQRKALKALLKRRQPVQLVVLLTDGAGNKISATAKVTKVR